jgi:iron(III) transport system substrate-binding protein
MKNKLFVLLAGILVASLVLGCAKPATSPTGTPSPAPPPEKPASDVREQIIAKAKEEGGELVLMGSNLQFTLELEGFKEKYPFIKMTGIKLNTAASINRAMMEVKAGRVTVDFVDVSDDGGFTLAREGGLQKPEVPFPHLVDFDPRFQPSSGLFTTFALSPRIQGAYNTELVPPDEVPTSWEEMTDPKFKGKTTISASSEEMPGRYAWLWRKDGELNWERSFAFFEKIFQQEPLVTKGYRRGAEQLAAGEKGIFWFTVGGPIVEKQIEGAPVGLIAFPEFPAGFRIAAVLKGAPHPNTAWLLIDYIISPEGQNAYSEWVSSRPLNTKAKPGRISQVMIDNGADISNSEAGLPDYTIEAMAAKVYTSETSKKSEQFYLQGMGVK